MNAATAIPVMLRAGGDVVMYATLEEEWTYKEVYERMNQLRHALINLGMKRNDKIGYMSDVRRVATEVMWGAISSSFIPTDVNVRFRSEEIEYVLDHRDVKILVADDTFIEELRPIIPKTKVENVIVVDTGMGKEIPEGWFDYGSLIIKYPKTEPEIPWEPLGPDDPMVIANTTGTTGKPKGVIYNLTGLLGLFTEVGGYLRGALPEIADLPKELKVGELIGYPFLDPFLDPIIHSEITKSLLSQPATGDLVEKGVRVLLTSVLNFLNKTSDKAVQSLIYTAVWPLKRVLKIGGMVGAEATVSVGLIWDQALGPILATPTALLSGKRFDPIEMYKLIEKYKLGILLLSGDTMINILCDAAESGEYDTSSVMVIASTSMPTSPYTRKRLAERFPNMMFIDSMSSSEVVIAAWRIYTHDMCMREEPTRFPMPSYAKIFDVETHEPAPVGTPGMFCQYAGAMSAGYYKEPEKYEEISFMYDGMRYLSMGDYAVLGEDGFFTLVGRGSEVINTGGLKVWCEECEGVVVGHPKVKDVAFAGVPDKKWGEAVTALIQLEEGETMTEKDLIDWCRDKMAGYKVPKRVIFGDVPYVDIGKKRRRAIKSTVMEKLGIE